MVVSDYSEELVLTASWEDSCIVAVTKKQNQASFKQFQVSLTNHKNFIRLLTQEVLASEFKFVTSRKSFYFSLTVFAVLITPGCDNVQEATIPIKNSHFYSQSTRKQGKQPELVKG